MAFIKALECKFYARTVTSRSVLLWSVPVWTDDLRLVGKLMWARLRFTRCALPLSPSLSRVARQVTAPLPLGINNSASDWLLPPVQEHFVPWLGEGRVHRGGDAQIITRKSLRRAGTAACLGITVGMHSKTVSVRHGTKADSQIYIVWGVFASALCMHSFLCLQSFIVTVEAGVHCA